MKIIFHLLFVILLVGCSTKEFELAENDSKTLFSNDEIIDIHTTRNEGNALAYNLIATRSEGNENPFIETKETESIESVVLPELTPHIWIGNIMKKSSIANCNYKPLIYPRVPINVALTLPNTVPKEIMNPSFTAYLSYIQEQTEKGSFAQNGEFNLTIEQFTSYNELKVAFGSNVNTSFLFWGSSSSSETVDNTISRATGLYVKFYQTSFKAIMDYPQGDIASIPANLLDSAVYINSISYGRLGIMTLETNFTAQYSKETVSKVFNKVFSSGTSKLTTEEQSFLEGCDYKLYLIGGNGNTSVESFTGYQGFIQHIKAGIFSKSEPGAPLFCTFNHVKDNSPVKIRFKFNIKKEPLYVELLHKPKLLPSKSHVMFFGGGDLYLCFYRDRSKTPTIAPPYLDFKLKMKVSSKSGFQGHYKEETLKSFVYQNAGFQTSMMIQSNISTEALAMPYPTGPPWDREMEYGTSMLYEYYLEPNDNYVIVGQNPINRDNTNNKQLPPGYTEHPLY